MIFKPNCQTTANSGMPHTDPQRACEVILRNIAQIPIMPNLSRMRTTRRSGINRITFSEGMPGLVVDEEKGRMYFETSRNVDEEMTKFYERCLAGDVDYFAISPEYIPGQEKMLELLQSGTFARPQILKFHVNGPVTWGLTVNDEKGKPIFYNEAFRDAIVKTMAMKVRWQEKRINQALPGLPTMVQFGEPMLGTYSSAYASISRQDVIDCLNECLAAVGGLTYIHCCANIDWPMLLETNTDILSFDAYEFAQNLALYPDEVGRFLDRGGVLAWGIVPTTDEKIAAEDRDSLVEKLETAWQFLVDKGFDKRRLIELALITPSCGTGSMSDEGAERVFSMTREVAEVIQQRYFS